MAAAALVVLALSGCVPMPSQSPPPPSSAAEPDPDEELTITSGGEPAYTEIIDGYFADDEDALEASIATYEALLEQTHAIAVGGDPRGEDLSSVATPMMEESIRSLLALYGGAESADSRSTVTEALLVRRIEDAGGALVFIAVCQSTTASAGGVEWATEQENTVSLVSTADDPRHLRVEATLPWRGEPIC
ncbi:hypothetical protein BJ978_001591 [Agromyces terreus]|uniref:Lipoprotein n=1 Tax=Agromyces terreus TaxID=424795 RepID=A0A9X2KC74_9MICO|nr:hypothetical protein [Agromyces terreus]MCP2370915.1 hypothetical protein [Agromyces terreus]